ncbi:MAG TPA: sigma 54-interacting transcriptional regulator [Myxococcota bacterium]|nr:sigma 54-interacting transcriptional regulator [Myxococcota bacterium]HRY92733.1 sigma 54-interacting transcriptional regulator [Myxococcota bacterium]HSA20725.1 sigma 54-interacting transcriptional regulator [Myxococcota bacterium]
MTRRADPPRPDEVETLEPLAPRSAERAPAEPWLTILAHPDPGRIGQRARLSGERQPLSRQAPEFEREDGSPAGPLQSPFLSRKPAWLSRAPRGGLLLVPDLEGTALELEGARVLAPRRLAAADLARGVVLELGGQVALLLHSRAAPTWSGEGRGLVGASQALDELRQAIERLAAQPAPVLLRGESGAGKELVARALHAASPRAGAPMVCINLAAIPATTAASALFGHMAGAFTGARGDHRGYFEQAEGGSLLLDEIGTITPELQATLLRVLESGEIQPVGDGLPRRVDVRVMAATDEDLEAAMAEGRFRAPLYHRLSACSLRVPALRERRDDIPRLLVHLLRLELAAAGRPERLDPAGPGQAPWLPAGLVAELTRRPWPGNVRQLHNLARHLVTTFATAEQVDAAAALQALDEPVPPPGQRAAAPPAPAARAGELEPQAALEALRAHGFKVKAAAAALGISRTTLYALMEQIPGLRKARDLGREELERGLAECGGDLEALAARLEVSPHGLKLRLKELGLR